MPVKQGGRLVELSPEVVKEVDKFLDSKKRPEPDFTKLVNAFLEEIVAKENFLQELWPCLETIAARKEAIYVKDKRAKKVCEISLTDHKLHCNEDNGDQCEHAKFALALSEFGKLVINANEKLQKELNLEQAKGQSPKSDSDPDFSDLDQTIPIIALAH